MSAEGTIAEVLAGTARWCVVEGDNAPILAAMPDRCVDACVTDPPYGIGAAAAKYTGVAAEQRDYYGASWDEHPAEAATIAECRRVSCSQIIFGGNYFCLPPARCWLVWDKLNGANDFADCEIAWTNLDRAIRRIAWRWHGMIRRGGEERQHPTQKPLGVMLWAIGWLPPGDVILDPYVGSGTTGAAALRLGRRFIGIEKDPGYAAIARERLRAEVDSSTLQAVRAGQVPMFGGKP